MRMAAVGLTVRYPGAAGPALDAVSVEVPAGRLTAVIGPNGSGKSTLLRALLGVQPAAGGSVTLEGRDVRAWDRRDIARRIGVVPQAETVAFPMSVRDLVAMGRYPHLGPLRAERAEDRAAIARSLERCDVAELADRRVTALSGGELQRARIARALAQEPAALALDEPTASLDMRHEMSILELLRGWADGGMTVLLITHQLNLAARFADRIVLLDRGRVVAEGEPSDVFRTEIMEPVYAWPLRVFDDPATAAPRVVPLSAERPAPPR
ncbi:MAG: ABC transporter ATP-binding protein [Gemmatimonadetes bacterium]|nr:ABC transporter ATP-binding protein [Gemmatimonadota bacterium]